MRTTLIRIGTALALVAVAGLAGACSPGGTPLVTSSGSPIGSAGSGQGGAGTLTLSMTEPVNVSGHAGTSVSCSTGRVYVASTGSATIDGYQVTFTVRAAPYNGAGSYPSVVTLRLSNTSGAVAAVGGAPNIPATITDTGGSFSVNTTGENGRTVQATLEWICS